MRILYVNSGVRLIHEAIDNYIWHALNKTENEILTFDWLSRTELLESTFSHQHIPFDRNTLAQTIGDELIGVCARVQPDWVITLHGGAILSQTIETIQTILQIPCAVWLVDDPYEIKGSLQYAPAYHMVFTVDGSATQFYRERHINAHTLSLGFDPVAVRPHKHSILWDISFVGTGFPSRLEFFGEMLPKLPELRWALFGQQWNRLGTLPHLQVIERLVSPAEFQYIAQSTIVNLNLHRANDDASFFEGSISQLVPSHPNNRTFELAGMAAFQLIDHRLALSEYFSSDEIISFYPQEFVELAKFWSDPRHSTARDEISQRALVRATNEHTYDHRITTLISQLKG